MNCNIVRTSAKPIELSCVELTRTDSDSIYLVNIHSVDQLLDIVKEAEAPLILSCYGSEVELEIYDYYRE